jgi:2-iminoacetate synthase ThiH
MRTTAFGGGETLEQRVDFLEAVRGLQEETGGFGAFAAVSAEAPNERELDGVTAVERLKTLAIARMFLDNIENVQASGTAQGLKVLQTGLRFGANDVGPVRPEAGSEEDVRRIIRDAGFRPAQRDILRFRGLSHGDDHDQDGKAGNDCSAGEAAQAVWAGGWIASGDRGEGWGDSSSACVCD